MESLRQALHEEASGVPPLGDIDRAIDQVTTSRCRWAGAAGVAAAVVALLTVLVGPGWQPVAVEPAAPQPSPAATSARGAPASTLVAKIPLGRDYGVAVDSSTGSVLVTTPRAVYVIDAGTREVMHTLESPGLGDPYGVAVDPKAGEAYVTDLGANRVAVVDTATWAVVAEVPVGRSPMTVAVDPAAKALYVGNRVDGTVSVIDTTTREVIDTVTVVDTVTELDVVTQGTTVAGPRGLGVDPVSGDVYVANGDADTVSVIDRDSRMVVETITGLDNPQAVAVDPTSGQAYVSTPGDDAVVVINTRTREVVDTIEVSGPSGLAVDPTAGVVYVNANGLTVIDSRTHSVIDTIAGSAGFLGIAVEPKSGDVYVINGDWGYTSVYGAP